MRGFTFTLWGLAISGSLIAQRYPLDAADSLRRAGLYFQALALYQESFSQPLPDSLRLRAYLGAAQAALEAAEDSLAIFYARESGNLALHLRDSTALGLSLALEATGLTQIAQYEKADSLYAQAYEIYIGTPIAKTEEKAEVLRQIADLRAVQGRFAQAESLYHHSQKLYEECSDPLGYSRLLTSLGALYYDLGRFREAEAAYQEALSLQKAHLPPSHPQYLATLNNLAALYMEKGLYGAADSLFRIVWEGWKLTLGRKHPYTLSAANNLAILRLYSGHYSDSEKLLREVVSARAATLGTSHPDYLISAANLGYSLLQLRDYLESEALFREIAAQWMQLEGPTHPHALEVLSYLIDVYQVTERLALAESLALALQKPIAEVWGPNSIAYLNLLNKVAEITLRSQNLLQAEQALTELFTRLAEREENCGLLYAEALRSSARLYLQKGDWPRAEKDIQKCLQIIRDCPGTSPQLHILALEVSASLYEEQKRYDLADSVYAEMMDKLLGLAQQELPNLPTTYRERLVEEVILSTSLKFERYVAERGNSSPSMVELGYRVARSIKGLVLTSVEGMRYLIESRQQSDTVLQNLYQRWKELLDLWVFYTTREEVRAADSTLQLVRRAERALLERLPELRRYFPDFAREPLFPPLRKGEALIEVVRVPHNKADSVLYLFYILTSERGRPTLRLHVHRTTPTRESRMLTLYEVLRSPEAQLTGTAYQLLWKPLEPYLPKEVRFIYFSPDGIYYRINIATLYHAERKEFLGDRYVIRYIASSRRLLLQRLRGLQNKPVIIGNPAFYDLPREEAQESPKREKALFAAGISSLPAAEMEARNIAKILGAEPVIGSAATEAFIKSLRSPRILHIATHGYFLEEAREAMLSGALLLAQAGIWDSLYAPFGVEDGRLTAQEASTLNLLGTELVVLSACETALGKIKGEGLYGLQRGFLEAGARRVMAALWPVDDTATRELMETFYRRWQANPKLTVEEAFTTAIKELRKKYPHPYYWGAFVVMQ